MKRMDKNKKRKKEDDEDKEKEEEEEKEEEDYVEENTHVTTGIKKNTVKSDNSHLNVIEEENEEGFSSKWDKLEV